ncbi:2'-5' RNA ligase family protein [Kribbella sp. NPDC051587]|uniref:2'-5' RNA ligase family protein n=1 Tax=Kribbella sp. NPDC051587 TaxID=3364119 RepID=UPI0037931E04
MKRFFDTDPTRWTSQHEKLHIYAIPPEPLRELAAEYHDVMREHGHLISTQPPQWLHVTVQLIDRHLADLTGEDLEALIATLDVDLSGTPAFTLTMGPPVIGVHSVGFRSLPPTMAFTVLVDRCRVAIADVLGEAAIAPEGAQQKPHASLGYGVADGDSDSLIGALNALTYAASRDSTPITFAVDRVHLVAVDQDLAEGRYTWRSLATFPLRPAITR